MSEWRRLHRNADGAKGTAAIMLPGDAAWVDRCQHDPRAPYWDVRKRIDDRVTLVGCYASPYLAKRVKESLEREWANAD